MVRKRVTDSQKQDYGCRPHRVDRIVGLHERKCSRNPLPVADVSE